MFKNCVFIKNLSRFLKEASNNSTDVIEATKQIRLIRMADILDFLMMVGSLKQLRRTGWVRNNVKDPESVADHMFRMAIMAFFMKKFPEEVDYCRCIKMALVHDLAECIIGDLTPDCGIPKEEKLKMEKAAMEDLCTMAGEDIGYEILSLWEEYENRSTPEAKIVKELDIFDMVLQAYEYEKQENRPFQLQEFFEGTTDRLSHPEILKWLEELQKRRSKFSLEEKKEHS